MNDIPTNIAANLDADELSLDSDRFMRTLLRELSGTLEDVVGLDEAAGFISVVGGRVGHELNTAYRAALQLERLSPTQVADVLVDLKRRINGQFYIIEQTPEKIVFGNSRCPFGDKVKDRQSLCMMTSNVFGRIAAANVGYAKVTLDETIARGDPGCHVTVYLRPSEESEAIEGREYRNGH